MCLNVHQTNHGLGAVLGALGWYEVIDTGTLDFAMFFFTCLPKAKAGLGVQSLRPSVRPSVPKSCHRNSSETTDPIIMKLGM